MQSGYKQHAAFRYYRTRFLPRLSLVTSFRVKTHCPNAQSAGPSPTSNTYIHVGSIWWCMNLYHELCQQVFCLTIRCACGRSTYTPYIFRNCRLVTSHALGQVGYILQFESPRDVRKLGTRPRPARPMHTPRSLQRWYDPWPLEGLSPSCFV
jgi:hypothetical protein